MPPVQQITVPFAMLSNLTPLSFSAWVLSFIHHLGMISFLLYSAQSDKNACVDLGWLWYDDA